MPTNLEYEIKRLQLACEAVDEIQTTRQISLEQAQLLDEFTGTNHCMEAYFSTPNPHQKYTVAIEGLDDVWKKIIDHVGHIIAGIIAVLLTTAAGWFISKLFNGDSRKKQEDLQQGIKEAEDASQRTATHLAEVEQMFHSKHAQATEENERRLRSALNSELMSGINAVANSNVAQIAGAFFNNHTEHREWGFTAITEKLLILCNKIAREQDPDRASALIKDFRDQMSKIRDSRGKTIAIYEEVQSGLADPRYRVDPSAGIQHNIEVCRQFLIRYPTQMRGLRTTGGRLVERMERTKTEVEKMVKTRVSHLPPEVASEFVRAVKQAVEDLNEVKKQIYTVYDVFIKLDEQFIKTVNTLKSVTAMMQADRKDQ